MKNQLLIHQGKLLSKIITSTNLGNGSTWPGHLALKANPHFIRDLLKKSDIKVIFVVGTNGKTTTSSLITHLLTSAGKKVILNTSGANLINGIASTLLLNTDLTGKLHADFAVFEIDENAFVTACNEVTPDSIIILNLFRDQLDRYGEVHTIAQKWKSAIEKLPSSTQLFLNADDPQISFLGKNASQKVSYFGLNLPASPHLDHASDSTYCPVCKTKLIYKKSYYSHLGEWSCPKSDFTHAKDVFTKVEYYPIAGTYNMYNIHAAVLAAKKYGCGEEKTLQSFKPAYGRQEKIAFEGKYIEIVLAKNPAGFNQTLQTILSQKAKNILVALNDRIADGTDVSWIWDVDFEKLPASSHLTLSGDRVYDLAVRFKYAELTAQIELNLINAIRSALEQTPKNETLYILPTYTAMLDIRKYLVGKKIL